MPLLFFYTGPMHLGYQNNYTGFFDNISGEKLEDFIPFKISTVVATIISLLVDAVITKVFFPDKIILPLTKRKTS